MFIDLFLLLVVRGIAWENDEEALSLAVTPEAAGSSPVDPANSI